MWRVGTKRDLGRVTGVDFEVGARDGLGIDALLERVSSSITENGGITDTPLISRERDRVALAAALEAVDEALDRTLDLELMAESLRLASDALARLIGVLDPESVLDRLFLSFCIGK